MTEYNYPNITVETVMGLRMLIKDLKNNPKLLDNSPYDDITKQTLKQLLSGNESNEPRENIKLEDLDYEKETLKLYQDINEIDDMEIDAKERMSLVKIKAGLIQDLLNMIKDSKRIKEINRFEEMIYSILTEEQKNQILER